MNSNSNKNNNIPMKRIIQGCYIWFNSIRNSDNVVIGKINKDRIETADDNFINNIWHKDLNENYHNKQIKLGKAKYQLKDIRTNKLLALIDNKYNVFDLTGTYLGTLKVKYNILMWLLGGSNIIKFTKTIFAALVLIASFISFFIIKTTNEPIKIENIIITENDGKIVTDKWNIFANYGDDNPIYPGKKGFYNFSITNPNSIDMVIDLAFDEKNIYNIGMTYRVTQNRHYLSGDSKWHPIDDLKLEQVFIKSNSTIYLVLEWYWQDNDEIDTNAGLQDDAIYTIYVELVLNTIEDE